MASIAFSVTLTDGSVMSRSASVADADVARMLAAFASTYAAPDGVTPDGPYLVGRWIADTVAQAMLFVKSYETSKAAAAAANAVTEIPYILT